LPGLLSAALERLNVRIAKPADAQKNVRKIEVRAA
jgi:hypothetical protein